jgi:acetyl esterase/lipase
LSTIEADAARARPSGLQAEPDYLHRLDTDMRHVLEVHAGLGGRPIESCKVAEARALPGLDEALRRIIRNDVPSGVETTVRSIPGPAGGIDARLYAPADGADTARPAILYFHGGAFVVGGLDDCEATPRALARRMGAVVVSSHYRQAPEHRFPAAHEDAWAAWRWLLTAVGELGADPARLAIVGEGSGGNLAVNVALRAAAEGLGTPRHLVLITPMATMDFDLPSHRENLGTRPLSTADLKWASRKLFRRKAEMADPRIDLIERTDLGALPPTTVVLAEHDPLRSEGQALAAHRRRSGVWVDEQVYEGVTHGFVGLSRVVNKAVFAEGRMARNLTAAFRT